MTYKIILIKKISTHEIQTISNLIVKKKRKKNCGILTTIQPDSKFEKLFG